MVNSDYQALEPPREAFQGDIQPPPPQEMTAIGHLPPYNGPVDANPLIDSHTAHLLGNMVGVVIRQKASLVEGLTGGMCEMRNKYTIHPGNTKEALNNPPMMAAMERSNACSRCCCAPYHNVFVEFKHSQDPEAPVPAAFTFERTGCCTKCVGCCNWADCCLDSMNIHAGPINEDPDMAGKLSDYSRVIGSAKQPKGCSFIPQVNVFDGVRAEDGLQPSSHIKGPCFFGGCSELCVDSKFPVSRPNSSNIGDVATIRKLRPETCGDVCSECFTDSDRYIIEFKDKTLTPQQKATILGSSLLVDFMFFELDNGMCSCRNNQLTITFFLCYCAGCLCPCKIILQGNN